MSFILVLVTSATLFGIGNNSITVTEFSTDIACFAALNLAKERWATVNDESGCYSVEKYTKRQKLKKELQELK